MSYYLTLEQWVRHWNSLSRKVVDATSWRHSRPAAWTSEKLSLVDDVPAQGRGVWNGWSSRSPSHANHSVNFLFLARQNSLRISRSKPHTFLIYDENNKEKFMEEEVPFTLQPSSPENQASLSAKKGLTPCLSISHLLKKYLFNVVSWPFLSCSHLSPEVIVLFYASSLCSQKKKDLSHLAGLKNSVETYASLLWV